MSRTLAVIPIEHVVKLGDLMEGHQYKIVSHDWECDGNVHQLKLFWEERLKSDVKEVLSVLRIRDYN